MRVEIDKTVMSGVSNDDKKGEPASYAAVYWVLLKAKVKELKK